jgi:hypothetical protein
VMTRIIRVAMPFFSDFGCSKVGAKRPRTNP